MGDQIGRAVEGRLYHVPHAELQRLRTLDIAPHERAQIFADACRLNALYMIARAGSGHIGSSFSSLDIMSWLLLEELSLRPAPDSSGDVFFSSKGHDAPALYAILMGIGKLDFDHIHRLRRIDGLPGHPDVGTPGIVTNTGSLGMGISKAKGMVWANRRAQRHGRVIVMTGDGELQEGQFWESLVSAANHGLHEIVAIVDHNKLQSDTFVANVSDLGDLEAKLGAFGWQVARCDGHDVRAVAACLERFAADTLRPKILIADTVKGKGVSFMEHTALDSDVAMYRFHSGAPEAALYQRAAEEIMSRLQTRLAALWQPELRFEHVDRESPRAASGNPQRLIPAYTQALLQQARSNSRVVALDADLVLDTGLISFREAFPDRFFESGIAEQDMVSMAGGMALGGLLPVVHSFACFLSARPNEQIYNNASEKTRIVYVGSLAGVVPGGPGHSHQAVRDISALAAIPAMVLAEPSCEQEVGPLLDWCLNRAEGSSYLRLLSLPWEISYSLPAGYAPQPGRGAVLRQGNDAAVVAYGPVLLSAAMRAADLLEEQGVMLTVVNLPWLNVVDDTWFDACLGPFPLLVSLDNHYTIGGQGDRIASALARRGAGPRLVRLGVDGFPPSGTNDEVLERCGLSARKIVEVILPGLKPQAGRMSSC